MELSGWLVALGVGLVVGLLLSKLIAPWFAPWFTRWYVRRRMARHRPPKGTRPQVRLDIRGVTYDVTDDLIRAPDSNGLAVWAVVGPPHVRMVAGQISLDLILRQPEPLDTRVEMHVTGPPQNIRFETAEEIRQHFDTPQ